jgi:hypothetical protein
LKRPSFKSTIRSRKKIPMVATPKSPTTSSTSPAAPRPHLDREKLKAGLERGLQDPRVSPEIKAKAERALRLLRKFPRKKPNLQPEGAGESAGRADEAVSDADGVGQVVTPSHPRIADHVRDELSHAQMHALADLYDGWAQCSEWTPDQPSRLIRMADDFRGLADLVGPEWNPPEPDQLSAIGFLARKLFA